MSDFVRNLLARHKDPTRLWTQEHARMVVDLGNLTVGGARLGDPIDRLRGLGRSSCAWRAVRGQMEWANLGIACGADDGRISYLSIGFEPSNGGKFSPFGGRFEFQGREVVLTPQTQPPEINGLLGAPFGVSTAEWDSAIVLFYETEQGEAQFAFDYESQCLESLEFNYEPELGDEEARVRYGIPDPLPSRFNRKL